MTPGDRRWLASGNYADLFLVEGEAGPRIHKAFRQPAGDNDLVYFRALASVIGAVRGVRLPQRMTTRIDSSSDSRQRALVVEYDYRPGTSLRAWVEQNPDRQERRRIASDLDAQVRRLWDAGVRHGDLSDTNVLVHEGAVALVDLDSAQHVNLPAKPPWLECGSTGYTGESDADADAYALDALQEQIVNGI